MGRSSTSDCQRRARTPLGAHMLCTRSPRCRWSGLSGLATLSPKLCRSAGDSWIADSFVPAHGGPDRILLCIKILYALWTSENWELELYHTVLLAVGFLVEEEWKSKCPLNLFWYWYSLPQNIISFFGCQKKSFLGLHQNLFLSSLTELTLTCQHGIPRFAPENLEKNKQIYLRMEELANKHQCSPTQLALAWVLHQGDDVVPIPGVTL